MSKKVKVVFDKTYPKFNAITLERSIRFNYIVVSGDTEDFIADKTALGFASIQDDGEHKGKPRLGLTKDIGQTAELVRVLKKNGTYDWSTDDMEQMLEEAYLKSESSAVQAEFAKDKIVALKAKIAQASARMRAQKAEKEELEAKASKTNPKLQKL